MTPRPDSLSVCPRCGSTSAEPLAQGGVCLRCAGLRALSFGAADLSATETGERIGPYEVVEELGRGGMGRVVAACQPGLGRIVAVKTIRAGVDPELDLRFLREIQTLSRLRHPHIVAIHDSGQTPDSLYFSMDYIEGGDLATRLRGGALHPREAVPLLRKVASALAYLHSQGVLHRDLKPSNILLDGIEPMLADFGLAAQLDAGGDLTALTRVLGTPHYLAPEALLKGSAAYSVAGDIYSFGVIFYELLTGRTPFAGASPEGLLNLVQDSEPPAPRLLVPSLPRDLEVICLKCLDRDPAKRYTTATALEEDLVRFQTGQPILARPLSRPEQLLRWARRRPHLAAIWLLVCAIAVVATFAAVRIAREHARAEAALVAANTANALAREHLRTARLAEASAIVHSPTPGRRAQALAALSEAAAIRPGIDLRNAALTALTTVDAEPVDSWDLQIDDPAEVTYSRDGRTAALRLRSNSTAGSDQHTIILKEHGRAELFGKLSTPAPILGHLEFSSDGGLIATRVADSSLRIWSLHPIALAHSLEHRPPPGDPCILTEMRDYSFAPDGPRLAAGRPGGGLELLAIPGGVFASWVAPLIVQTVKFSPDGRWLAAARLHDSMTREVVLFDGRDLRPLGTLPTAADLDAIVWAADSRNLGVITVDNACTWFSIPDGHRLQRIAIPSDAVIEALGLGPENSLALRFSGSSLRLLDGHYGRVEFVLNGLGVGTPAQLAGGREFVTTSFTNQATRWRLQPRLGWNLFPSPCSDALGAGCAGTSLDFSQDGRWLATADGNFVVFRDTVHGRLAAVVEAEPAAFLFSGLAFSADGTHLLRCSTATGLSTSLITQAHDAVTLGPTEPLDPAEGFMLTSHASDRRTFAFTRNDTGTIRILRLNAAATAVESRQEWRAPGAYTAALSPDGSQVLVNCSGIGAETAMQRLAVYRTRDGSLQRELPAQARGEAVWCTDGTTAMTSNGTSSSIIWNTSDWTPRCTLGPELGGDATTFTLSSDGRLAVVFRDNWLNLLSAADGQLIARLELKDAKGFCLSLRQIAPDRFAALQIDGRLDLLDLAAWQTELTRLGLGW